MYLPFGDKKLELLNLDDLAPVEKQVRIKGVDYVMAERQVGQMIESIQAVKRQQSLVESEDDDLSKSEAIVHGLIDSAKQLLPDCPEDVLRNCSVQQISAILEFANQSDADIASTGIEEKKEEKTKEKEKTEA